MNTSATFSEDRVYRYSLLRRWRDGPYLNVVGLNPSTANEVQDDPTIRRCINYAKDWGYSGLVMTNIFGFRSTDPKNLLKVSDPVGPDNLTHIILAACGADMVLAAWGNMRTPQQQEHAVGILGLLSSYRIPVYCLRITAAGYPAHPLYQKRDIEPELYRGGK